MEDRFKFRFWHNEYKKMVEVYNLNSSPNGELSVCHTPIYDQRYEKYRKGMVDYCKVSVGVLEQCTGLKDKNGKLVFEGDVVREYGVWHPIDLDDQEIDYLFVIKWCDCDYMSGFIFPKDRYGKETTFEVIGNVHENKELLKNEDR